MKLPKLFSLSTERQYQRGLKICYSHVPEKNCWKNSCPTLVVSVDKKRIMETTWRHSAGLLLTIHQQFSVKRIPRTLNNKSNLNKSLRKKGQNSVGYLKSLIWQTNSLFCVKYKVKTFFLLKQPHKHKFIHLCWNMFRIRTNEPCLHVVYSGNSASLQDLSSTNPNWCTLKRL